MRFSTDWHQDEMSTKMKRGTKILLSSLSLTLIEPIAARLSLTLAARPEISCLPTSCALAYFGYQRSEEFLGHTLHHTCDQTRPKLRHLSAYLGL